MDNLGIARTRLRSDGAFGFDDDDFAAGQREFAPVLAKAALAVGANGLFIETHPKPDEALSDGPNMIPLADMAATLKQLLKVYNAVR